MTTAIVTPLASILASFGDGVVLLAVAKGSKNPILQDWTNLRLAAMHDPAYRRTLESGGNIGLLTGEPSGGVCALDFDTDADADNFLSVNPLLTNSFRSRGARGCQVWVRIHGLFPDSCNIKNTAGKTVCEWRATGRQSIVWGTHPSGCRYTWLIDTPPLELPFAKIVWPDDWRGPWMPEPEDQNRMIDRELIDEHGEPFTVSKLGKLTLNSLYFVGGYAHAGLTLYEPGEGSFYGYSDARGLWHRQTEAAIKIELAGSLKRYADALPPEQGQQIINARSDRALAGMVGLLKGLVEEQDAFTRGHGVVHVANGMLHLAGIKPELHPFAAGYRSRNVAPVAYDPAAECPRFRRELLESALDAADVSLVQRYAGACLLGRNVAQKILVLTGTAGGGKSTLLEIIEKLLGVENVGQLRTEHLSQRFEIARFVGRLLLTGKDVPGRFLEEPGAHALKALVGHDLLDGERKGSNASVPVRGDFAVVITCNSRLRVRLDGDGEAWRRRLLIVRYERPKPERPEPEFADHLLASEGAGILRWMVDGARAHLSELAECGDYRLTGVQRQRVNALLAESDSVREFIRERVRNRPGTDVAVHELTGAYAAFCEAQGWEQIPVRLVENELRDAMQEVRKVARRNDIYRDGKERRGFSGVELIEGTGEVREV